MQYQINYKPAFATIFITLKPGESIISEAGAMTSMDAKLSMTTAFSGGFFPALVKKFLGGETLFVNTFKNNTQTPLTGVFSQSSIGDIEAIELQKGQELCFQSGAYIASSKNVKLGVSWAGFASWFSGEGLFRLKVIGPGVVFFGGYGGITKKQISQEFIVDTGHLIAYEPGVKLGVGLSGGLFGSLTSGEGFVSRLKGNGTIYLQSRSVEGLARFLGPKFR
ncbi:MAG: TIGR00266 family protein [Oscillatoriales cyanobacterium RM1_1_9]|nr:TIGR00266 family protein [Oscillatoriales cyanobacterium SM2_3_0]NJO44921.1 TIGR00266 family protein [Oscillatoriales cyanobacterium RM2_1_1]NJO70766.1 TIGR00266 family protein [Oscillatoriales cyanobacterium RM1_1_9]